MKLFRGVPKRPLRKAEVLSCFGPAGEREESKMIFFNRRKKQVSGWKLNPQQFPHLTHMCFYLIPEIGLSLHSLSLMVIYLWRADP